MQSSDPLSTCCCSEFVVNIMNEWYVEAANHTCGPYDRGINEMTLAGLTPLESVKVRPLVDPVLPGVMLILTING